MTLLPLLSDASNSKQIKDNSRAGFESYSKVLARIVIAGSGRRVYLEI